jgi:hypothetical protein
MTTPAAFVKARTLANKLMATCQPSEFWDDLNELTKDENAALDSIAFECQGCNHWFSALERHEGPNAQWFCKECL